MENKIIINLKKELTQASVKGFEIEKFNKKEGVYTKIKLKGIYKGNATRLNIQTTEIFENKEAVKAFITNIASKDLEFDLSDFNGYKTYIHWVNNSIELW